MIEKISSRGINKQMNPDIGVGYARKSSEQEDRQIPSIPDQLKGIKELQEKYQIPIVKTYGESKSAKIAGLRPDFNDMINGIKKGKFNTVYVDVVNRLSRNAKESGEIIDLLDTGVLKQIISPYAVYNKDTNSEMLWIEFMSSTKFSKDLSKIVKERLKRKAERGDFSGVAPIGYLNTPKKLKGTRDIVIDKKRVELVRKWWELMLTGKYTIEESLAIITKKGLRTRKGQVFSRSAASAMFRNIFYAGKFNYGGEQYFGNHKPIVTMSEWSRVQRILDRKGKKGNGTLGNPDETAFQGILKCGECGCAITMQKHTKHYKNGTTQVFWYYACTKRRGKCTQRYLNSKEFDTQLKSYLDNIKLNPEFSTWLKKVIARRNEKEFVDDRKIREQNTKRLDKIMDEKKILFGMKNDGLITDEDYQKQKRKLLIDENNIREDFKETNTNKWGHVLDNIIDTQKQIKEMIEEGDIPTKQMALQTLGLNLMLKDKKVVIKAKDAFIFFRNIQNDVWSKNGMLEPQIMPILPRDYAINRTSKLNSAGDRT